MVALVSVQRVKDLLKRHEEDDAALAFLIEGASGRIIRHLDERASAVLGLTEAGGLPEGAEVPEDVQIATICLVGHLLSNPEAPIEGAPSGDVLPVQVLWFLRGLRDPAFA